MNFVALVSGGKDSIFTCIQCIAAGHKLVCLANLSPPTCKETDSFMYQTVGSEMIQAVADAIGVPVFRRTISGAPINVDLQYKPESKKDEVEDLYELMKMVKEEYAKKGVELQAVCAGAILSSYQKVRVESVCERLKMQCLAPLWRLDQKTLLDSAVRRWGVDPVIVKVCTLGLDEKHLGKHLRDLLEYLDKIVLLRKPNHE